MLRSLHDILIASQRCQFVPIASVRCNLANGFSSRVHDFGQHPNGQSRAPDRQRVAFSASAQAASAVRPPENSPFSSCGMEYTTGSFSLTVQRRPRTLPELPAITTPLPMRMRALLPKICRTCVISCRAAHAQAGRSRFICLSRIARMLRRPPNSGYLQSYRFLSSRSAAAFACACTASIAAGRPPAQVFRPAESAMSS